MKTVRSNLLVLMAQKAQREGRRISLRKLSEETRLSRYVIYAIANNSIQQYPKEVLARLCEYLECDLGDLLKLEEATEGGK
jgi:DNA-binding Xre family transcriptional regulator